MIALCQTAISASSGQRRLNSTSSGGIGHLRAGRSGGGSGEVGKWDSGDTKSGDGSGACIVMRCRSWRRN